MSVLLDVDAVSKLYPVDASGGSAVGRWLRARFGASQTATAPPTLHAVDGVSFSIAEGESVGLVGESGCGKSTLVRVIARLIDPSAGRIVFNGQDVGAVPAARFGATRERGQIQVVFQDSHDSLNPRFTGFDCIADPLRRLGGLKGHDALRRRAAELADLVGLPRPLLSRFPHQLSGGQKARVNIARAIAVNPRLLILDEPTSALDVSVQAVILHLLADLRARLGMSYLFVSHDLNVVRLLCDRVLVMYLGKVIEIGGADSLFNAPAHPYTRALISAIPSPSQSPSRESSVGLNGELRSPIDPDPNVCRFYGRCPSSTDLCEERMPMLQSVAEGHSAACHFAQVAPSSSAHSHEPA